MLRLPSVRHPDPDIAARGRILQWLCVVLIIGTSFLIPDSIGAPNAPSWLPLALGGLMAFYALILALTTAGYVQQSGIAMATIQLLFLTITTQPKILLTTSVGAFFLVPAFFAALIMGRRMMVLFTIGGLIILAAVAALNPQVDRSFAYSTAFIIVIVASGLWMIMSRLEQALERARVQAATAQTALQTLQGQEQELQRKIIEATEARSSAEAARAQVQQQLSVIQQQRETIQEMSIPLLPVTDNTLLMPLVGALDSHRLKLAQELALHQIEHGRHRFLILDITGVIVIDTQVAQGLLKLVEAAKLLGTNTVLVGMRPEVAQAVVGLGLHFSALNVRSSLRDGLDFALSESHHRIRSE